MRAVRPCSGACAILPCLLLLLIAVCCRPLYGEDLHSQVRGYQARIAGFTDPFEGMVDLIPEILTSAGSSLTLEVDPNGSGTLLVSCGDGEARDPALLVVVDLHHVIDAVWTLSVWSSLLAAYSVESESCYIAFSILPPSGFAADPALEAGKPFWFSPDPYQMVSELNPTAVLLLDFVQDASNLKLEAESRGRLTPLQVLEVVRASLDDLGLSYRENVVKALYARAGLIDGSRGLAPWLELSVPAIRLQGRFDDRLGRLPGMIRQALESSPSNWSGTRDVNYLRYQLPAAVVIMSDVTVTRTILLLLAAFIISVALRPVLARSPIAGPLPGALPEALLAYLFSFIAVSISWLIHGAAARLFGSVPLTIDLPPLHLFLGITGKFGSAMLFFFALSGLSARLGLLPHAVRGTASQASAMIAGVLGVSVLFSSIQGSLLLFWIMILLSLAGINAAVAIISIAALAIMLYPLVFNSVSVIVPSLVTMVHAQGQELLLLAGFTAPVALWILTTLSPRHRLVRGNRTAPYLVALGMALCFLDPWLRSRL